MVRFLSLVSFTDKGIHEIGSSLNRATAFRSAVESQGGQVLSQYWALGEFDGCVVFECPDDKIAASLLLKLGQDDNVKTRTMRVFDATEFESILQSVS